MMFTYANLCIECQYINESAISHAIKIVQLKYTEENVLFQPHAINTQ
jgi:hypothetical protein